MDVAGLFFYYYLAWSITATLEPRGVFHHKGKDITFTVKKSLSMMSFPPFSPKQRAAASEEGRRSRAGESGDAARCFSLWESHVHPSPLFCCVLSFLFFFHLGERKKKQKRCYSKNCRLRQQSNEKEYVIIYRRIQLLGHLGESLVQEPWEGQERLRVPLCKR